MNDSLRCRASRADGKGGPCSNYAMRHGLCHQHWGQFERLQAIVDGNDQLPLGNQELPPLIEEAPQPLEPTPPSEPKLNTKNTIGKPVIMGGEECVFLVHLDQTIGFASYDTFDEHTAVIASVEVDVHWRNQGYEEKLLAALEDKAKNDGFTLLRQS